LRNFKFEKRILKGVFFRRPLARNMYHILCCDSPDACMENGLFLCCYPLLLGITRQNFVVAFPAVRDSQFRSCSVCQMALRVSVSGGIPARLIPLQPHQTFSSLRQLLREHTGPTRLTHSSSVQARRQLSARLNLYIFVA
jgi:hypothetical protein